MTDLLIRADASARIGAGHVLRCLALAEAWLASASGSVGLVAYDLPPRLAARVEAVGAEVVGIPPDSTGPERLCALLHERTHGGGRPAVALDGYAFGPEYQAKVQEHASALLVVDDNAHLPHYSADLLLNQNIGADRLRYVTRPNTRLLLGPAYALLRSEFRRVGRDPLVRQTVRRVLVTMGGSDPSQGIPLALDALTAAGLQDLTVRAVVGPLGGDIGAVAKAAERLRNSCGAEVERLIDVTDMASQMAWADVAISAAGSTVWELAHLGVPMVLVVTAANQAGIASGMSVAGAAVVAGHIEHLDAVHLGRAFAALAQDPSRRAALRAAASALVDGRGAERVVEAISARRRSH